MWMSENGLSEWRLVPEINLETGRRVRPDAVAGFLPEDDDADA
jgi:hypothetical protein